MCLKKCSKPSCFISSSCCMSVVHAMEMDEFAVPSRCGVFRSSCGLAG